jgi:hypothetical protein
MKGPKTEENETQRAKKQRKLKQEAKHKKKNEANSFFWRIMRAYCYDYKSVRFLSYFLYYLK